MNDTPNSQLQLLAQLATEYGQKFQEVQELVRTANPDTVLYQLKLRSEMTTDRFRAAQQALLAMLSESAQPRDENAFRAVASLCRSFDEMRILFQHVLEIAAGGGKP